MQEMTLTAKYLSILCSVLLIGCVITQPPNPVEPLVIDFNKLEVSTPEVDPAESCNILPAIDWMNSQEIIYTKQSPDEWRDCSGNFLRLSSRIATMCPGLKMAAPAGISKYVHNSDNTPPGKPKARTTRGLAKWYDEKGLFSPVFYDGEDTFAAPMKLANFRNKIKPGTVFWFSLRIPKTRDGIDSLYKEDGGAIGHMGTVVNVTKDDNDKVTAWTMYHGQNIKKNNGITHHKWEKSGNRRPIPQGGYDIQRIVGFAPYLIPNAIAVN
jgi:hypothetical protein